MKKVSMQDIADAVNVARSTVSFVLNGKEKEGRIGEEVARRVRAAAKEMNYQFNEVARSLRTGDSRTIALIVADISDAFFGTLAYHLQEYAMKRGYVVVTVNTSEREESLKPIFEMLKNRQVDGIIMIPVANIKAGVIEGFDIQTPTVLVDRYFPDMKVSRVTIDNHKAGLDATNLLIGKGCKRIALLTYNDSLMHMQDRKRGYTDALKKAGLYDPGLVCEVEYKNHEEAIHEFFKSRIGGDKPIDGLFISTGGLSGKGVKILTRLGVEVQKDLQIVGFDRQIDTAANISIPYVKQPMESICQCALDILLNQIKNKSTELVDCRLQTTLVEE